MEHNQDPAPSNNPTPDPGVKRYQVTYDPADKTIQIKMPLRVFIALQVLMITLFAFRNLPPIGEIISLISKF